MAKRNIDFEVYERQDTSAQVNWTKAAADLTTTLTDIRDDRVKRKDALNQEYLDTQDLVNDLGQYDNTTLQTLVMNIANNGGEMLTNFHNEVKAGRAKPSEQNMFAHNLQTDMTLLKKNALAFDTAFKNFAEREKLQESARAEGWWAGQLTGFASLNNFTGVTDALTGKISLIDKNDPSKSTTLQQLTVLMNQQIDAFDYQKQLSLATSGLGVMIESEWNSRNPGRNYKQLDKEEQTAFGVRFIEENEDNEEFQNLIKSSQAVFVGSPQQEADYLATVVPGPDGKVGYFKNGSQDDFDAWEKDNPGKEKIIVPELPPGDMTTEGTEFRKWLRETYSEYATDNDISAKGSNDWAPLISAYAEYGQEYAKDFLGIEPTTTKGVNPIMVQYMGDDGLAKVTITDEQNEASSRLAKEIIIRSQDSSYTVSAEKAGENAPSSGGSTRKNESEIAADKARKKQSSRLGEYIIAYTDADPAKREAAMANIIAQGNAKIKAANAKLSSPDDYSPTIVDVIPVDPNNPNSNRTIIFSDGTQKEITGDFTEQTITLDFIVNPDDALTRDSTEELADERGFNTSTGITSAGDATTVSQPVYELPDYDGILLIDGQQITPKDYISAEYGFSTNKGEFTFGPDTTKGIAGGFESLIKGAVNSDVLKQFKNNGKGLSVDISEDSKGYDVITFNFGGMSYVVGNTDDGGTALFSMNGYDLWQELQDKLLNPVLKAYNKVRSGRGTSGTSGTKAPSDIRLKKNINKIGSSSEGYNIYSFEYIDESKYGSGVYQGVMAQEVPHARVEVGDYYHVDYSKLDVTFKKI